MTNWNKISRLSGQWGRSLPRWIAVILLLLLGLQSARLVYALTTGAGPVGVPTPAGLSASADKAGLAHDPFGAGTGQASASGVVTALPLRLFGTRIDFATGRGSAIIATPDGVQQSFLVGETIMPGAKLASVAGDHVEIDRNGTRERLYLDQSVPAPVASAPLPTSSPPPSAAAPPAIQPPIQAAPAPPVTEVQQTSPNSASEQPQP